MWGVSSPRGLLADASGLGLPSLFVSSLPAGPDVSSTGTAAAQAELDHPSND